MFRVNVVVHSDCKHFLKTPYFTSSETLMQREKAAEDAEDIDPEVAAMMGFGGFRSSKT